MALITRDDLLRYEELKQYQKSITEELDALNVSILEAFQSKGIDESPRLNAGKIVLRKNKGWEYSGQVTTLEEHLAIVKATEKANGTATETEIAYLKYQPLK